MLTTSTAAVAAATAAVVGSGGTGGPSDGGDGDNSNKSSSSDNNKQDTKKKDGDNDALSVTSQGNQSVISMASSAMVSGLRTSLGQWKIIAFGQVMSLLMAARGCASTILYVECDEMAPAFVLLLVYTLLTIIYFTALVIKQRQEWKLENERREQGMTTQVDDEGYNPTLGKFILPGTSVRLHVPWHKYAIMTICEVEANYVTLIALKYTSVKSATLLDTLGIPTAMLASYYWLSRRYACNHIMGAVICMLGATIIVFSDYEQTQTQKFHQHPNAVFGDIMAALGGMLYGIADVLIEEQVKFSGRTEFLAMLGFFGCIMCAVQVVLLELPLLADVLHPEACTITNSFLTIMFVVCMFCAYYMGLSKFLIVSEAAFLNLSLLTSDMWSVGFSIVEEHEIPTSMFIISMFIIMIGVLVYESVPSPMGNLNGKFTEVDDEDQHDLHLDHEQGGASEGAAGGFSATKTSTSLRSTTSTRSGEQSSSSSTKKVVELPPSFSLT